MSIPVVITIDTEPDNVWADHHSRGVRNVPELLRLQRLLDEYGARATLLVTHEIATNDEAVAVLGRMAGDHGAEIGAHLHPWDNPPFLASGRDREFHTHPHELPIESFEAKLATLTEAIEARFEPPRSYRAGRYGFVAAHVPVLLRLGYSVDTSVTPLCDWRRKIGLPKALGGVGGANHRDAPLDPYLLDDEPSRGPAEARLWEAPVTIYASRPLSEYWLRRMARLPEIGQRILRMATGRSLVWARPTGFAADDLRAMLTAWLARGPAMVNIMFHSSELLAGGSPSTPTAGDVADVYDRLRLMLDLLVQDGRAKFTTLREWAEMQRTETRAPAHVA